MVSRETDQSIGVCNHSSRRATRMARRRKIPSLAGYALFQDSPPDTVAFVLAFAAGAILTMLAQTMMPEAYEHGGKLVGVVTTLGFAVAFAIHTLD